MRKFKLLSLAFALLVVATLFVSCSSNVSIKLDKETKMSVQPGEKVTLPSPEKEGSVFAGWYDEKSKEYYCGTITVPEKSLNLTSTWISTNVFDVDVDGRLTVVKSVECYAIVLPRIIENHEIKEIIDMTKTRAKYVELPDSVEVIYNGAFKSCTSIKYLVIPSSVKEIGRNAFSGWNDSQTVETTGSFDSVGSPWDNSKPKIKLVSGSDRIGNNAFNGCLSFITVNIPETVVEIGASAFQNCARLEIAVIPNSVVKIGESAFSGCSSLLSVELFGRIKDIPSRAFLQCNHLSSITLPDSVETIGESAFSCTQLKTIAIPESVIKIGKDAFYNCLKLTEIKLPGSLKSIEEGTFEQSGLSSIVIPDGVETIGSRAFARTQITEVIIPDSVTAVGSYCFLDCEKLERVIMSDSISVISNNLFESCENLKEVKLPSFATHIGKFPFKGCEALEEIVVPATIKSFDTGEVSKGMISLVKGGPFHGYSGTVTLADGFTEIPKFFFASCNLRKINIPVSVESINYYAFCDWDSIYKEYSKIDEICYMGTMEEWDSHFLKSYNYFGTTEYKYYCGLKQGTKVNCSDGQVKIYPSENN